MWQRLWKELRSACITVAKLAIFIVIVADSILALATILYAVDTDKKWIFVSWIGLAFIAFQFVKLTESYRAERGIKNPFAAKMVLVAVIGAITGAIIWPVFDDSYGSLIGIAFGSLLGITIKLTLEVISLSHSK